MTDDLFEILFDLGDVFAERMEAGGIVDYPDHWGSAETPQAPTFAFSQASSNQSASPTTNQNLLEIRVARLQLVTQAMWEMMRERDGVTDKELEEKILEIDLRDGRKDGAIKPQVTNCGSCGRKTGVRQHRRCIYCGHTVEGQHIVDH